MSKTDDKLKSLEIQFYAVSSVLAFLILVLIAVVVDLFMKVKKLTNDDEYEDDENDPRERPPPPPVNSGFSFPKPNFSKNLHDEDTEIRRQNDQKEYSLPKPAVAKSWQGYPGERNQPKRNQGNDFRQDDNMSNYSYDNGQNSGGAYRNPLSGNNDSDRKFNYADNNRQSRQPAFKIPSSGGNSFGGNDNFGFKRDNQRNNNYY